MSKNNTMSIQEKTEKLAALTAWFDSDDFVLEQALDKFKEAEMLAAEIEKDLNELKNEITVVKQSFADGE